MIKTREIKLGNSAVSEIIDSRLANNIREHITSLHMHWPSGATRTVENKHDIMYIRRHPYLVQYLLEGGRPLYIFLTMFRGKAQTFYLEMLPANEMRIIVSRHRWSLKVHEQNTMFSAVLYKGAPDTKVDRRIPTWHLVINDIVSCGGSGRDVPGYATRIARINRLYYEHFTPDPMLDPVELSVVDTVEYKHIQGLWNARSRVPYSNSVKGLQFVPLEDGSTYPILQINFDVLCLWKWQLPSNRHGVLLEDSVRIREADSGGSILIEEKKEGIKLDLSQTYVMQIVKTDSPDVYNLWYSGVKVGLAHVPSLAMSEHLRGIFHDQEEGEVNCVFQSRFKKWMPVI